jgi:hypothetical protein
MNIATMTPMQLDLIDARLSIDVILGNRYGDADPATLVQSAIDSLRSALAAIQQPVAVA